MTRASLLLSVCLIGLAAPALAQDSSVAPDASASSAPDEPAGPPVASRDVLAMNLPLFPRSLQLPIPLGLNLLLMPGEHVLRRDVSDGAVQTHVIVMLHVTPHQTPYIFE